MPHPIHLLMILPKPVRVTPMPNYRLRIRFEDGLEGIVDLSNHVGRGVFSVWEEGDIFEQVRIGPSGELVWTPDAVLGSGPLYEMIAASRN